MHMLCTRSGEQQKFGFWMHRSVIKRHDNASNLLTDHWTARLPGEQDVPAFSAQICRQLHGLGGFAAPFWTLKSDE
jgi:hypothetical protein